MKFLGFYDYTVILTYLSLFSAVNGMTAAGHGRFTAAVLCLMLCGICDMFDGTVARTKKNRTDDEKAFGIQIDSLCDAVSFGVFPGYLSYCMGLDSTPGIVIAALYTLCAVIRLAFFNVQEAKRQQEEDCARKTYRGLPVTSIAIIYPLAFLLRAVLSAKGFWMLLHIVMAATGFLFVLDFSVKKVCVDKLFSANK